MCCIYKPIQPNIIYILLFTELLTFSSQNNKCYVSIHLKALQDCKVFKIVETFTNFHKYHKNHEIQNRYGCLSTTVYLHNKVLDNILIQYKVMN